MENYYHNNKRTNNEMNVVNTRTNILYIYGCHTRTNHKKISHAITQISHVVTLVSHTLEIFLVKRTSSIKAIVQMPKSLKKIHAWLHEDMQQVELGGMLGIRNLLFSSTFPFIIPYISLSH